MLTESRLALTVLAGRTVVDAASTDGWDTVRCGYARLLGRGDTKRTRLAEQRLDETRKQLIDVAGTEVWLHLSSELALRWTERLADLLAENPDAADFFAVISSTNRYAILYRIGTVKRPETRARKRRNLAISVPSSITSTPKRLSVMIFFLM